MSAPFRATVTGWRWDYLCPLGWMPSSGTPEYYGKSDDPRGWYVRERAACLLRRHYAPDPDCTCGLHAVEHLSDVIADRLDELDALRDLAVEAGTIPDDQALVITLSRVDLTHVLPTAWPDDAVALASHPAAVPDPPHTVRARSKTYREVLVDRDWPALPGGWPPEVMPRDGVRYVPDLAAWVREQNRADIDALMDAYLEGQA